LCKVLSIAEPQKQKWGKSRGNLCGLSSPHLDKNPSLDMNEFQRIEEREIELMKPAHFNKKKIQFQENPSFNPYFSSFNLHLSRSFSSPLTMQQEVKVNRAKN
jgi:hypothetical protein